MTTYEITFNEKTKTGKNFLTFLEENKKYVKVNNPAKMTKEEFYAKILIAYQQCKQGKSIRVEPKDFEKFLGLE